MSMGIKSEDDIYPVKANELYQNGHELLNNKDISSIKKSIEALEEALALFAQSGHVGRCSEILNTLGIAYCTMAEYEDSEKNIKISIEYLKDAIKLNDPNKYPIYHAMSQYNLGNTYKLFSEFKSEKKYIKMALDAYKSSARVTSKYYYKDGKGEQTFDSKLHEMSQKAVEEIKRKPK